MSTRRYMLVAAGVAAATCWAVPAAADDAPGAAAGDAAMTCEQIAAELAPYMRQMMPGAMAMGSTANAVVERGKQRVAAETPAVVGFTVAATAAHADPTGIASRAVGQAEFAHQEDVARRALVEDKPLHDRFAAQTGAVAAQGQQLQSDARLQRLMQMVQEKHCDAR